MTHEYSISTVTVSVREPRSDAPVLGDPASVASFLSEFFETLDSDQEHVVMLTFDGKHRLSGIKVLSSGTRTQSCVDPQRLFRIALELSACSIVIAHNHPSGDLEPSRDDIDLTRRIANGGEILGIPLNDHIIVSPCGLWLSLRLSRPALFSQQSN